MRTLKPFIIILLLASPARSQEAGLLSFVTETLVSTRVQLAELDSMSAAGDTAAFVQREAITKAHFVYANELVKSIPLVRVNQLLAEILRRGITNAEPLLDPLIFWTRLIRATDPEYSLPPKMQEFLKQKRPGVRI